MSDRPPSSANPPSALPVVPENIPADLRARPQWVLWRWEWRAGKNGGGDWTKPPYQTTGRKAKANDPKTWTTFEAALAAYQGGEFAGLGFCLTDDEAVTIGDLDDCRDAATGAIAGWAEELLAGWPSYAELSPSGTGLRLVGRGRKPGPECGPRKYAGGKVEMYDRSSVKYLTFTGHRLNTSPAKVTDAQEHIDRIHSTVFAAKGKRPKAEGGPTDAAAGTDKPGTGGRRKGGDRRPYADLSDDDLLALARAAKNGAKFAGLFDRGDLTGHADDHSRADAGLCQILAFWCRKDADRIDRLFRRSKLFRPGKWDEKHRRDGATYGTMTIGRAVELCEEVYDPGIRVKMRGGGAGSGDPPGSTGASDWPPPAVVVLRQWLRDKYGPTFRRGPALYSAALGRDLKVSEVSACPTSDVLALLAAEPDSPRDRRGSPDPSYLPMHYRTWLPVAWGDIATGLPEEVDSAEVVEPAREEFIRTLTAALVTMVPLSYRHADGQPEEVQRRPVVEWARMFARSARWESVRGYRIWSRRNGDRVRVAIRAELLGQVHARELGGLGQKRLTEMCVLYGVGQPCHVEGKGARATELLPEYLDDVWAAPIEPDAGTQAGEAHAPACESAS